MAQILGVIIVEKLGSLKYLVIKDYKEDELYKKCSFKKNDGFEKNIEWKIKIEGKKYNVSVYGKTEGKANTENKYDFPPPIDNTLFFGNCVLVCSLVKDDGRKELVSLSLDLWEKMYEKLFGGFEDLAVTAINDDIEEDELENIPAHKKTKHGYLKDGFVVDSDNSDDKDEDSDTDDDDNDDDNDDNDNDDDNNHYNIKNKSKKNDNNAVIEELELNDIGSELSEEEYSDEE